MHHHLPYHLMYTVYHPHPFKMKMPNFDFTLLWIRNTTMRIFAINKLSNFEIIQLAS